MRQDLKQRLVIWQKDLHDGESKRVMLLDSPAHNGEFVIQLEKSIQDANIRFAIRKKCQTAAQANIFIDPVTDLLTLNDLIDSLDREFDEKYVRALHLS
jgi:hypothetical protein